jgi:hypothetical protein
MGVVYRARQTELKRLVALKMILAGAHAGREQLDRFRREAEAVARLHHPNIVQIYEIGEHDGHPYFSLEFVAGGTLAGRLAGTPLPAREAAALLHAAAEAIHYAHEQGIVHRDLKPGNILLSSDGDPKGKARTATSPTMPSSLDGAVPKIADFGLAKRLEEDSGQTGSGAILGTPSYMAPEQAEGRNREVGPAADVYALGAILYETLTGQPPFRGPNVLDTLDQVRRREPVPPGQLQPSVPRDLELICLKCLRKEPARRYASAAELGEELRRFQAGEPLRYTRAVSRAERLWRWCKRNPVLAGVSAAAIAFLVATAVVSVLFAFNERRNAEALTGALDREQGQRIEALRNLHTSEENRRKTEYLLAEQHVDRGIDLCDSGDIGRGLLWMALALQTLPPESPGAGDLEHVIRTNLAGWHPRLHRLQNVVGQEGLRTVLAGKTAVMVAHRLSTIREADLIYVLHQGRVLEQGTHRQLLAHGGRYAELWRAQTGGEEARPAAAPAGTPW